MAAAHPASVGIDDRSLALAIEADLARAKASMHAALSMRVGQGFGELYRLLTACANDGRRPFSASRFSSVISPTSGVTMKCGSLFACENSTLRMLR